MVFTEHVYQCSGCGKEEKSFGVGPFPIKLRDDRKIEDGKVYDYNFCDLFCLRKWVNGLDEL